MLLRANDEKGKTPNESVFFPILATCKVPKWLDINSELMIRLSSKVLEKIRNQGSIDINALSIELRVAKSTGEGALQHLMNLSYLVLTELPDATCQGGALLKSYVEYLLLSQYPGSGLDQSSKTRCIHDFQTRVSPKSAFPSFLFIKSSNDVVL